MTIPGLFKEYIWMIETINRFGGITFAQLDEQWRMRSDTHGEKYSRTTFNRHREAIMEMFGLIIECDLSNYRYYIENKNVLEEDSVQNWLFSTLSVSNILDENMALHDRILLESIPSGDNTLHELIKAMRESRRIMMTYRKYDADAATTFSAAPYCVKLFRRRWYVLAKTEHPHQKRGRKPTDEDFFAIYSLDRIEGIELQDSKFTVEPDFDAADFFDECFGVVVGDGSKPVRVVLRAYGKEQHYMRDLPIHHSQKLLRTTEDHTDFELYLRPTTDFMAHLLSRGGWLQVISPRSLAKEILKWHQEAIERYENCE